MKKIFSLIVLAAFVSTGFLISFSTDAEAIAAFARKEGAECTLCHVGFPKLNSFGYEYKQRGYRMEDTDGVFVWDVPMQFAGMAALGFMRMDMNRPGTMQDATQSKIQTGELQFFSAGNLGPKVSYFLNFIFEDGEIERDRTLVILDDILPDSLLNIKTGTYDASWFWLSGPRKLGMTGYLGTDTANTLNTQGFGFYGEGVEINGILPTQTRYQIGVGNDGVGTNAMGDSSTDFSLTQFYAVLDQTFEFAGEPRVGFIWKSNRLGMDNDNITGGTNTTDRSTLLGTSLDLNFPLINLTFAYFNFNDANAAAGGIADYDNWLIEGIIPIGDKILIEAFYEKFDLNRGQMPVLAPGTMQSVDADRWAISGHYFIVPNVDIIAEYSRTSTERQMGMAAMPAMMGQMAMPAKNMVMGDMDMDMFMLMFHLSF